MRILLVEDEQKIANFVIRGLKEQGMAVDHAPDGEEALFLADVNDYDCIVLDLVIPKIDGFEVCRRLRAQDNQTPILILSARSQVNDRVTGLDAGADDYLAKPFAFEEFIARIRALCRRSANHRPAEKILEVGGLKLNPLNHEVSRDGVAIELTAKEYALLEYFMRHAGQVVTRTMLSEHVWNEEYHSLTNVIDVHVRHLRKKIDENFDSKLIHTKRGAGYILKSTDCAAPAS